MSTTAAPATEPTTDGWFAGSLLRWHVRGADTGGLIGALTSEDEAERLASLDESA